MVKLPLAVRIRRGINSDKSLSDAEKLLLGEICRLFHKGSEGCCRASNKHLAAETGAPKETVSRRLARLQEQGWLVIDPGKDRGNDRTMQPTNKLLSLYGEASQNPDPIDAPIDVLALPSARGLLTFSTKPIDVCNGGLLTIKTGAIDVCNNLLLIVRETVIRQDLETEERRVVSERLDAALASLAAAEGKVKELEGVVAVLKAKPTKKATAPPVAPAPPAFDAIGEADTLPHWPADAPAEFVTAWREFVEMRCDPVTSRQKGRPAGFSRRAAAALLTELAAYPVSFQVVLLTKATGKEWAGAVFKETPTDFADWQQASHKTPLDNPAPLREQPFPTGGFRGRQPMGTADKLALSTAVGAMVGAKLKNKFGQ